MNTRILIVEDDAIQQKLYRLLCARFGFDCIMFTSAQDAAQYLNSVEDLPSLALIDWFLKGESGLNCVKQLKQICAARGSELPVVAVTANAFDGDKRRCLDAGANDYLAKPFSIQQFETMVNRWSAVASAHSGVA
jgi:CheY-like chemotaxis protein